MAVAEDTGTLGACLVLEDGSRDLGLTLPCHPPARTCSTRIAAPAEVGIHYLFPLLSMYTSGRNDLQRAKDQRRAEPPPSGIVSHTTGFQELRRQSTKQL